MTTCYKEKDQTPHAEHARGDHHPPLHAHPIIWGPQPFMSQGDQSGDDGERSFPWEELLNGWLCVSDPSRLATESTPEDKHGP